jgi:hypothetical protein
MKIGLHNNKNVLQKKKKQCIIIAGQHIKLAANSFLATITAQKI